MLPAIDRAAIPATHLGNVVRNALGRIVPQADAADKLVRCQLFTSQSRGRFVHRNAHLPKDLVVGCTECGRGGSLEQGIGLPWPCVLSHQKLRIGTRRICLPNRFRDTPCDGLGSPS